MAKVVKGAEVAQGAEKRIPLKIRVSLEGYDFTDGNGDRHVGEKVKAALIKPFPEYADLFDDIRIAPRWSNDAAVFAFRMRVYFRTHDDVTLDGWCEPVGYESKRDANGKPLADGVKGEMVYYPGLFFHVPYRGEPIEFGFKQRQEKDANGKTVYSQSADSCVFRDIVAEKWGGSLAPAESAALEDAETDGSIN